MYVGSFCSQCRRLATPAAKCARVNFRSSGRCDAEWTECKRQSAENVRRCRTSPPGSRLQPPRCPPSLSSRRSSASLNTFQRLRSIPPPHAAPREVEMRLQHTAWQWTQAARARSRRLVQAPLRFLRSEAGWLQGRPACLQRLLPELRRLRQWHARQKAPVLPTPPVTTGLVLRNIQQQNPACKNHQILVTGVTERMLLGLLQTFLVAAPFLTRGALRSGRVDRGRVVRCLQVTAALHRDTRQIKVVRCARRIVDGDTTWTCQ
jgi:hypothetical protein